jgi:hypothetical protein
MKITIFSTIPDKFMALLYVLRAFLIRQAASIKKPPIIYCIPMLMKQTILGSQPLLLTYQR